MATLIGQTNLVLKDLTTVAEDTIAATRPSLLPKIATKIDAPDEAYVKVPIASHLPWPRKLQGQMQEDTNLVGYVEEFDQETFVQMITFNSDLMKDAKAFKWSDMTAEAGAMAVQFLDYVASQVILLGKTGALTGDGKQFYSATHYYANMGTNVINNIVTRTGVDVASLFTDMSTAQGRMLAFLDNQKRLLNRTDLIGPGNMLVQCPVAAYAAFRGLANNEMIPIGANSATSNAGVTNTLRNSFEVFPDGYLDADPGSLNGTSHLDWYLHYISQARKPLAWIQDYAPRVTVLGFGSEYEAVNHKVAIVIKQRFHVGFFGFWRSICVHA